MSGAMVLEGCGPLWRRRSWRTVMSLTASAEASRVRSTSMVLYGNGGELERVSMETCLVCVQTRHVWARVDADAAQTWSRPADLASVCQETWTKPAQTEGKLAQI